MKEDRYEEGKYTEHGRGLGTPDEALVRTRAGELALIKGRSPKNILPEDLEEARRELTGEEGLNPPPAPEEALPEEERWDPVAGDEGHRVPVVPAPDEQTVAEKLVEEGVEEAEHEQMVEATRAGLKRDHEQ